VRASGGPARARRPPGNMGTKKGMREYGNMGTWEHGNKKNMGIWEYGNMGIWECGNVGIWECGNEKICEKVNWEYTSYFVVFRRIRVVPAGSLHTGAP
jgi:hypothetical protein